MMYIIKQIIRIVKYIKGIVRNILFYDMAKGDFFLAIR